MITNVILSSASIALMRFLLLYKLNFYPAAFFETIMGQKTFREISEIYS